MISTTRQIASPMVLIDVLDGLGDEDRLVVRDLHLHPVGQAVGDGGQHSLTAFDTSSGLAVACLTTPTAMAGLPLKRTMRRSSTAPSSTRPHRQAAPDSRWRP